MANFFKKALPYLAGAVAGGAANQFSALKPFSAAISTGAGALANSKNRLTGALQGFTGGGVGSALAGGAKGMMAGNTAGGSFGSGAMEGLKTYGSSIPGFKGVGTSNPTGAMAKFFTPQSIRTGAQDNAMTAIKSASTPMSNNKSIYGFENPNSTNNQIKNYFGTNPSVDLGKITVNPNPSAYSTGAAVTAPAGANITQSLIPQAANKPGTGINWGQFAGGLAVPMATSMLTPEVKAPDYSSVTGPLRDTVNNTYANSAAKNYYTKEMTNPIGVDSTNGLAVSKLAHDKQVAETLRSFDQQWQAAMGGQNPSNNSEYQSQRAKILQDAESSWTAQQAQTQFQYDQAQKQTQMAAANALAGMDDSQLNALAGLAQYDVATIAAKTGMDIAAAEQIQTLAATAGSLLMQKSLGLNQVQQPAQAV